jgi:hypothetical protein
MLKRQPRLLLGVGTLRLSSARAVSVAGTIPSTIGSAVRTAPSAALTTPSATLPARATLTIRATLTATRRACLLQNFLLFGGENLFQLGLRLFFQRGDLLLLIRGQFEFLGHEPGQQVEAAGATRAAGAAGRTSRSAIRTAGARAAVILRWRTCGGVVIGQGPHGKSGRG